MRARGRHAGAALAAVCIAASALLGCSSGSDDREGTRGGRAGEGADTSPVDGGTLRLGIGGPIAVDPVGVSLANPADLMVLDLLHRGLTDLGPDGLAQPALAASWTSDPELTQWRFSLDPAATFASGRAVTSAEVVGSLQHVIAAGDASVAALRLEDVVGFRAFLDGASPTVEGLRALDARTVEIDLASPLAVLPELLAAPAYGIRADPAGTPPVQALDLSGDWAIDGDRTRTGLLELTRRPGAPGHLAGVEVRSYPDAGAAYDAFVHGDVDWAPVPGQRYGAAVRTYGDDHFAPFQAELFLGLRADAPPLADQRLRQAIAAGIDRTAIVRAVYPDLADPLEGVVAQGVPAAPQIGCGECGFDPARARSLLAQAFPHGDVPTVSIDTDTSPAQEALASIVAEQLDAVGIPTTKHALPLPDFQRFVVGGGQQLFTFGWVGGYGSPDAYLEPLLQSASSDNLVALRAKGVDNALAAARSAGAPTARDQQWAGVQDAVLRSAVVIPIAQFRTQVVVAARVHALRHAVDGTVDWPAVWVADAR